MAGVDAGRLSADHQHPIVPSDNSGNSADTKRLLQVLCLIAHPMNLPPPQSADVVYFADVRLKAAEFAAVL